MITKRLAHTVMRMEDYDGLSRVVPSMRRPGVSRPFYFVSVIGSGSPREIQLGMKFIF
jgi:hypothetical protein